MAVEILAILLCLVMFARLSHAQDRVDIAVLKNRADAIDRHLDNTDKNVADMQRQVSDLASDINAMKAEQRTAWAILGLLCTGGLIIRVGPKKGT